MRIKDLATRATKLLTGNAYMVFDNGTKVEKVDYAELAKQIITEYNTQTLAGSAQSVKAALDALNSNTNRNYLTLETVDCNAVTTPGIKRISSSSTNSPDANTLILITTIPTGGQIRQEAYRQNNAEIFYVRAGYITNNAWYFDSWVKYPTRAEMDAATVKTLTVTATADANGYIDTGLKYNQAVPLCVYSVTIDGSAAYPFLYEFLMRGGSPAEKISVRIKRWNGEIYTGEITFSMKYI